jgi:hypothetical protein
LGCKEKAPAFFNLPRRFVFCRSAAEPAPN